MAREKKTDNWYPFFVGDYRRDTARLSCEQHGAYRQLIDEYWITGPLPDDDAILARIVGLELRAWRKHRAAIGRFFTVSAGEWIHSRIDRELSSAAARVGRSARGGAGRWTGDEDAAERGRHLRSQRLTEARQRGTHTAEEWAALKIICGSACPRCHEEGELVKDHIQPIYQGGSDGIDNIQPLCRKCNASKGPEAVDYRPDGWFDALPNAFSQGIKRLQDACTLPPPPPQEKKEDADASSAASATPKPAKAKPKGDPWAKDAHFSVAWAGCTDQMRRRSSRAKAWAKWRANPAGGEAKLVALRAYLKRDPDVQRTGGPGLHIWLADKLAEWLAEPGETAIVAAAWDGPPDVRQAVERGFNDPAKAASYLRSCVFDETERVVHSPNGFVVSEIEKQAGGELSAIGVKVQVRKARAA